MSESVKEDLNGELEKAKSEGKKRAERIQGIVRDAFSQTLAEVKEGSGEIQAIVKQTLSKTLERVNETGEGKAETLEKTPSTSSKSMILAIFKAIRSRLFAYLYQKSTDLPNQYANLKNRAVNLDANLTERYGDRYVGVKQRLEKGSAWYKDVTVQAQTMEPSRLQQRQAEVENKLGEAGATVAQKEQQVKQQLKQLLQTAAAKL